MTTRESRAWLTDLEIRSTGDGRTVTGLAAPFGRPTEIADYSGVYTETIQHGAFARTISERGDRVRFLMRHDAQALPLGRALSLREDTHGLVAELRVSKTQAGDDALELIRDDVLTGLSIGFTDMRPTWSRDHTQRTLVEVRLDEISVVDEGAYSEAKVLAVRAAVSPHLDAAYRRLLELKR